MLLFTEPVPRPALWGGTLLRDYFHYPQFPDGIGQSWSFSAQEGEGLSNRIAGMEGMTLLIDLAVGLVVACTVYGFYALFSRGEI